MVPLSLLLLGLVLAADPQPLSLQLQLPEVAQTEIYFPEGRKQIVHILDWHWVGRAAFVADGRKAEEYDAFLEHVDEVQQQQMAVIRASRAKVVWVEGQSDKTISGFLERIEKLKKVKLPKGDSDVDELVRELYREDLLQIGAAGRLLLAGEIDKVLPLEDDAAWKAANPLKKDRTEFDVAANDLREQEMVNRLLAHEGDAVIVLGADHKLLKHLAKRDATYRVVTVKALPGRKR